MNFSDEFSIESENDEEFADEFYVSLSHAVESAAIFVLCAIAILGNTLTIIATTCLHRKKREAVDFYLLSLSVADLLSGLIVIPVSVVATYDLIPAMTYVICNISGYLHAALCSVCLYTFMWLSVDRYIANKKPLRYNVIQTRTRCACWVLFSWIMSFALWCPPLLGNSNGHFYHESFKCMLNISAMLPYSVTVGFLVFSPTVLTLLYTYSNMLSSTHSSSTSNIIKEDIDEEDTDVITPFMVTVLFFVSWTPWCLMKFVETLSGLYTANESTRFWLLWIGELHALWTPFVLTSSSSRIRDGLGLLCARAPAQKYPSSRTNV